MYYYIHTYFILMRKSYFRAQPFLAQFGTVGRYMYSAINGRHYKFRRMLPPRERARSETRALGRCGDSSQRAQDPESPTRARCAECHQLQRRMHL